MTNEVRKDDFIDRSIRSTFFETFILLKRALVERSCHLSPSLNTTHCRRVYE